MTTSPPTRHKSTATRRATSIVIVNTGDGKGKTTAAMGIVLRALARNWRVLVIQYVKSGKWHSGEVKMLQQLGAGWRVLGDGFTWEVDDLDRSEALARHAWGESRAAIESGEFDLVLLDEVTYPMNWGWIPIDEMTAVLAARPPHVNVVITGRNAPEAVVASADTVTEMVKVRHAYDAGIRARRGIDF